jgi:hypothetical protein
LHISFGLANPLALQKGERMDNVMMIYPVAAAGWAFLVWLLGGGFGLALLVFIVLKMLGK